jgi:hypothetical protein
VIPQQFGAKCDGTTDDTTALTNWAASLTAGSAVYVPSGNCIFKSPITFPKVNYVSLIGNGQDSRLTYAGSTTTGNLLIIGVANDSADSYCSVYGWTIRGLNIRSSTVMTGGDGLQLADTCQTDISNISVGGAIGGSGGNTNFYNGIHFNGGNTLHLRGYSFLASNKAEIINGDAGQQFTDDFQAQGSILGATIGLDIAGNVGGLNVDSTDILENGINVQVDQSVTAVANVQLFFGSTTDVDETTGGSGIGFNVTDAGSTNSRLYFQGTWFASAAKQCLYFQSGVAWHMVMTGGSFLNCGLGSASTGDGIRNDSTSLVASISGTTFGDAVFVNGGYGINGTVSDNNVLLSGVVFGTNTQGNFSADVVPLSYTNATFNNQAILLNPIVQIVGALPSLQWRANGSQGSNAHNWDVTEDSVGSIFFRAVNDAYNASNTWMSCSRTGYVVTGCSFAETLTFADSSTWSSSGIGGLSALGVGESTPAAGVVDAATGYQVAGSALGVGNLASISFKTIVGNNSGSGAVPAALTVPNVQAMLGLPTISYVSGGVNFNSVGDTVFPIVLPTGFTRFLVDTVRISGASGSLTSASAGVFTGPGATGTTVVTPASVTVSTAADGTAGNAELMALAVGVNSQTFTAAGFANLYFRVTAGEGSAATGNVTLAVQPLP